jgi:hypothetical protein
MGLGHAYGLKMINLAPLILHYDYNTEQLNQLKPLHLKIFNGSSPSRNMSATDRDEFQQKI